MNVLHAEKYALKELRKLLQNGEHPINCIRPEHVRELIETVNCIIGRINCELTDRDDELETLAIADGIRGL